MKSRKQANACLNYGAIVACRFGNKIHVGLIVEPTPEFEPKRGCHDVLWYRGSGTSYYVEGGEEDFSRNHVNFSSMLELRGSLLADKTINLVDPLEEQIQRKLELNYPSFNPFTNASTPSNLSETLADLAVPAEKGTIVAYYRGNRPFYHHVGVIEIGIDEGCGLFEIEEYLFDPSDPNGTRYNRKNNSTSETDSILVIKGCVVDESIILDSPLKDQVERICETHKKNIQLFKEVSEFQRDQSKLKKGDLVAFLSTSPIGIYNNIGAIEKVLPNGNGFLINILRQDGEDRNSFSYEDRSQIVQKVIKIQGRLTEYDEWDNKSASLDVPLDKQLDDIFEDFLNRAEVSSPPLVSPENSDTSSPPTSPISWPSPEMEIEEEPPLPPSPPKTLEVQKKTPKVQKKTLKVQKKTPKVQKKTPKVHKKIQHAKKTSPQITYPSKEKKTDVYKTRINCILTHLATSPRKHSELSHPEEIPAALYLDSTSAQTTQELCKRAGFRPEDLFVPNDSTSEIQGIKRTLELGNVVKPSNINFSHQTIEAFTASPPPRKFSFVWIDGCCTWEGSGERSTRQAVLNLFRNNMLSSHAIVAYTVSLRGIKGKQERVAKTQVASNHREITQLANAQNYILTPPKIHHVSCSIGTMPNCGQMYTSYFKVFKH
jgi:hypothetical protein